MQIDLPQIVSVGVYNSQLVHKTAVSPNRKTTMFELELPLDDNAVSYIDGEQCRSSPSTVICAKPGQMRHSRLPYKCYYVHMIVTQGRLLEKLMQLGWQARYGLEDGLARTLKIIKGTIE